MDKIFSFILKGDLPIDVISILNNKVREFFGDFVKLRLVFVKTFFFSDIDSAKKFLDSFYGERVKSKMIENHRINNPKLIEVSEDFIILNVMKDLLFKPFHLFIVYVEGDVDVNELIRRLKEKVVGKTYPEDNEKDKIRYIFSKDTREKISERIGYIWNVIHWPDNVKESLENLESLVKSGILTEEELNNAKKLLNFWMSFEKLYLKE